MSRLETWIKRQNPKAANEMTVVTGVDALHISDNPNLSGMVPRVGGRQMKTEDRSIPRISCAPTIKNCMYGHAAVHYTIVANQTYNGMEWVDAIPMFHIYRLNIEELVKPSAKLVPDGSRTNEHWVVPYAPEAVSVDPEKVGILLPISSVKIMSMGKETITNTFYLYCRVPLTLDTELLEAGYYSFTIDGLIDPVVSINQIKNFKSINNAEWQTMYKKMLEARKNFKAKKK